MTALVLMEVARTILKNHLYTFNEKLYRQEKGGPIGDNFTQIAARLVMFTFIRKYRNRLNSLEIDTDIRLLKVYVNDKLNP